ncbi:MAG: hypothetical protein AAFY03_07320, partial [Pseudomonadota bacterium]
PAKKAAKRYSVRDVQVQPVTNASPVTAAMAARANTLSAERPGEKWMVVFHAVSGTSMQAMLNDSHNDRHFSNDAAIAEVVRADGAKLGWISTEWTTTEADVRQTYADWWSAAFLGETLEAKPIAVPGREPVTGRRIDHTVREIYPELENYTKVVTLGTSWVGVPNGKRRSTYSVNPRGRAQGPGFYPERERLARMRPETFAFATRQLGIRLGVPRQPDLSANGVWEDISHFSGDSDDGLTEWARAETVLALIGLGLTPYSQPTLDRVTWTQDYVELGSSAGPITTKRKLRGLPPLQAGLPGINRGEPYPWWTDVLGFEIDDTPAARAEIVDGEGRPAKAGMIRIYPNRGRFSGSTVLHFHKDQSFGVLKGPDDRNAQVYLNQPMVDVGQGALKGLSLNTWGLDLNASNDLGGGAVFSTKSDKSSWVSAATTGEVFVFEAKIRGAGASASGALVRAKPKKAVRWFVNQTRGGGLLALQAPSGKKDIFRVDVPDGTYALSAFRTLRLIVDGRTGQQVVRLYVDDKEVRAGNLGQRNAIRGPIPDRPLTILEGASLDVVYLRGWFGKDAQLLVDQAAETPDPTVSIEADGQGGFVTLGLRRN